MHRRIKALAVGGVVIAALLVALGVGGYAVQALPKDLMHRSHETAAASSRASVQPSVTGPVPTESLQVPSHAAAPLIGVFGDGVPQSWSPIQEFAAATGAKPGIAMYYSAWGEPFWTSFAETAHAHQAVAFVKLQPGGVSLTAITAGRYDSYLRSYAYAVRSFGHPVILSFGHEMNGNWYSWGAGHVSPQSFIAAWRHVVNVFRAAGASNVTWVWAVSSLNAAKSPIQEWWPGSKWVNWVGIDGYYYRPSDTFTSVFGTTVNEIRTFTGAPILISETAAGPSDREAEQLNGLFRGIRDDRLLGLVWFDMTQNGGTYHQDWRLEDSPAALASFRAAVRDYG